MTPLIARIADEVLDIFLPALCPACGEAVSSGRDVLCPACLGIVERAPHPVLGTRTDGWDRLVAPFAYGGPVATAIVRFKHGKVPALGGRLARLALSCVAPPGADVVVPVPLHRRRLARRGFDQAGIVARVVASHARLPLARGALVRVRDTPSQGGLDRASRRANVRGAFEVRPGKVPSGARVLVVDDVWTTGATASECARVLRRAGAGSVGVYTLARVV